jgi:hypothetical protein
VLSFGKCAAVPPFCRALLWNGCFSKESDSLYLTVNAARMYVLRVKGVWLIEKAV